MEEQKQGSVQGLLLARSGVAFVPEGRDAPPDNAVQAVELELAALGYVVSSALRARLATHSVVHLAAVCAWMTATLHAHVGGDQRHEPLFRKFPKRIPRNTDELWWRKVLTHFVQAEHQPCIHCGRSGTTHVLDPCCHVVCDHCFDGSNYSACPVCEREVDRSSPFFEPSPERGLPAETIVFKRIALGESVDEEARKLFVRLCERTQALSPDDRETLTTLVCAYSESVLDWLPPKIPVRENVAIVFGTLFCENNPLDVLPRAQEYLGTATDVLRLIAVYSGTDGSLLRETVFKTFEEAVPPGRFWGRIAQTLGAKLPDLVPRTSVIPVRTCRFKVARLPRGLRRALLALLDAMNPEYLVEDMLRHRSHWVWVGEFLHPGEYAARFPNAAQAFSIVRKKGPDGTPAPEFHPWGSRVEKAFVDRDVSSLLSLLTQRPGEFARRFDFALRTAGTDKDSVDRVVTTFVEQMPALATPVLLTLKSHLPARLVKAPARIYWPKGWIAKGPSSADERPPLPGRAVETAVHAIETELLRRFAEKPHFEACLLDESLRAITVPFNERTASSAAVSLPRGSRIPVPIEKTIRLFLHWCQPASNDRATDLDLSVALYDGNWQHLGVCSYYALEIVDKRARTIARSAGDRQDAPWPDGATEFVDLHTKVARAHGARFAVMVLNSYAGLPFSRLERAFAGLMLREDTSGSHFDPRTVELKFALDGENGIFLPLVVDLQEGLLHWLDVQSKGEFVMNNVETSKAAIATLCPELIAYFASGTRPSMFDLGLLHAASRCQRVVLRGEPSRQFQRRAGETERDFYDRLVAGDSADVHRDPIVLGLCPTLALLHRSDVDLPDGSCSFALFHERTHATISASDLLS